MNDDEKGMIGLAGIILILTIVSAFISYRVGWKDSNQQFQREAIKSGNAEYTSDEEGNYKFTWKEMK